MSDDLFSEDEAPIPLQAQIDCLHRELALRTRVYPRWVKDGRMSAATMKKELDVLGAAIKTLTELQHDS